MIIHNNKTSSLKIMNTVSKLIQWNVKKKSYEYAGLLNDVPTNLFMNTKYYEQTLRVHLYSTYKLVIGLQL